MNTIIINDIKIEIRSNNSIYITKGNWIIYLDDSIETEKYVSHWIDGETDSSLHKNSTIEYIY